jgi:hypothetical protein
MDEQRDDTLIDGPEADLWRSIIEKLAREGEQVNTAVELADLVVRVRLESVADAALSEPTKSER